MNDGNEPSLLLELAPELRYLVWEALFTEPSERTIDEHVRSRGIGREQDILAITRVNHQLGRECLPFYWSCTIFRILHRGHRDESGFDEYFYKWLQNIADKDVKSIRHLEVKVKMPYVLPKPGSVHDPSVAIIKIDLNCPNVDEAMTMHGYYETCPLVIIPWVRKAVSKIPRVDRKAIVSKEVLWDIYEACYLLTRSDCRERRTWADFQRAYELNQSKEKSRPWSEDVYYEMSQEAIYGPGWRQREDDKKCNVHRPWERR